MSDLAPRVPTSLLAALGLIAGFGVADATGSRPLGGVVLAVFGIACLLCWLTRDDRRTALTLTAVGLFAFAVSHALGLIIGSWPAVLLVAGVTAAVCWRRSDRRWLGRGASALAS